MVTDFGAAATAGRPIGPVPCDRETIQNPYAVLIKGMVQAGVLLQLVSGSGKGQNPYNLCMSCKGPGVLIKRRGATGALTKHLTVC